MRGTLSLPDSDEPCPAVVVAHGASAGTRDYFLYRHLARLLDSGGVATFRYDRRGEGSSTGAPDAPFDRLAADLTDAVAAVRRCAEVDPRRIALWGISQGGWLVVMSAVESPAVVGLIVVSGTPVTPAEQMNHAVKEILTRRGYGRDVVKNALDLRAGIEAFAMGRLAREDLEPRLDGARAEPWFKDAWIPDLEELNWELDWDGMDLDISPLIAHLRVPTLLLFGALDPWIPVAESIRIWERTANSEMVEIEVIPGVGHEMIEADPLEIPVKGDPVPAYERAISHWVRRFLLGAERVE